MFGRGGENSATVCKVDDPSRQSICRHDNIIAPARGDNGIEHLIRLASIRNRNINRIFDFLENYQLMQRFSSCHYLRLRYPAPVGAVGWHRTAVDRYLQSM